MEKRRLGMNRKRKYTKEFLENAVKGNLRKLSHNSQGNCS